MLRKAYNWVTAWSETPYGGWALFVLAFAESSCFPIPPDVLLIALCVGKPTAAFLFASICSVASVLGGIAGYGIGLFAFEAIGSHCSSSMTHIKRCLTRLKVYMTLGVFGPAGLWVCNP